MTEYVYSDPIKRELGYELIKEIPMIIEESGEGVLARLKDVRGISANGYDTREAIEELVEKCIDLLDIYTNADFDLKKSTLERKRKLEEYFRTK